MRGHLLSLSNILNQSAVSEQFKQFLLLNSKPKTLRPYIATNIKYYKI